MDPWHDTWLKKSPYWLPNDGMSYVDDDGRARGLRSLPLYFFPKFKKVGPT